MVGEYGVEVVGVRDQVTRKGEVDLGSPPKSKPPGADFGERNAGSSRFGLGGCG